MRNSLVIRGLIGALAVLLVASAPNLSAAQRDKGLVGLSRSGDRGDRQMEALKQEVRHQLLMLPYYSVFDWLEAEVRPDGTVMLMGQVVRPTLKDDAEKNVKRLEAATKVSNNIEVLPLSLMDDQLRTAVYRSIYNFETPLFRYATWASPPIHIIVKNGHVTLKGIVATQSDSQLAYMAARQVPGAFDVKNELQIEQSIDEKVSRK
jgi:hyperosmotically inducible periplasmic protein